MDDYVVVGIDWGTGFTKSAYRRAGDKYVHPICVGRPDYCNSYIIPSVVLYDVEGRQWLYGAKARDLRHNDDENPQKSEIRKEEMKAALMADMREPLESTYQLCARYLYYILQRCRQEIMVAERRHGKPITLHPRNMFVRFPVPVWPLENPDKVRIAKRFERVYRMAWGAFARHPDPKDIETMDFRFTEAAGSEFEDFCEIYSELSCALKAFELSERHRHDKINIIYDVGQGTTEVTIVEPKGPDKAPRHLAAQVMEKACGHVSLHLHEKHRFKKPKGARGTLELIKKKLENRKSMSDKDVHDELAMGLQEIIWESARNAIELAWNKKKGMHHWADENVIVLLCGGISQTPFAQRVFEKSHVKGIEPYRLLPMEAPDDFGLNNEELRANLFPRMAVAYGLCVAS